MNRPKSPRTPNSAQKEESFWDKIGTLGRKKRIKEGERDGIWKFAVQVRENRLPSDAPYMAKNMLGQIISLL